MLRYHRGVRGNAGARGDSAGPIVLRDPLVIVPPPTGFWEGSYGGSPWTSKDANARILSNANPPSIGTAVNGFTPTDFDAVNDRLDTSVALSNFISAGSYTIIILFMVDAFTAVDPAATNPFDVPCLFGSTASSPCGGPGGTGAAGVFQYGHFTGAAWGSAKVAISTSTWTAGVVRYDGTNIQVGKNGPPTASSALGNATGLASTGGVVPSFGGAFFDGKIMSILTWNVALSNKQISQITNYLRQRYQLAL